MCTKFSTKGFWLFIHFLVLTFLHFNKLPLPKRPVFQAELLTTRESLQNFSRISKKGKTKPLGHASPPSLQPNNQSRSSSLFSVRWSCLEEGSFVENNFAETQHLIHSRQRHIQRKGSLQHFLQYQKWKQLQCLSKASWLNKLLIPKL